MEQQAKMSSLTGQEVFHICEQNGFPLDSDARKKLESYEILLKEWNSKVNLISRKDVDNIWTSHIFHSLTPLLIFSFPLGVRLLDIGTGGGLPGIPLAIARPDISVCLTDSIRKKTAALAEIVQTLNLPNADVVNGRVEEIARNPGYRSRFDGVIARAVAPLADLVKWSKPFIRMKAALQPSESRRRSVTPPFLIALKGGDVSREVSAATRLLRNEKVETINLDFPGLDATGLEEKKIVLIEFT